MSKEISFLAIPKCASITLKDFCDDNEITIIWHHYNFNFIREKLKNRKVFCVLRNPIDRVVSAYCYLRGGGRNYRDGRDWRRFCERFKDINSFIKEGLEYSSRKQLHFIPQSFWVDMVRNPILLSVNNLQEGIDGLCEKFDLKYQTIPSYNVSNKDKSELTDESIEIITKIYQKDVNLYLSHINSRR